MTESTQHEDEAIKSAIVAALDMLPTPLFLSAVAVDRSTEFIIAGKQSYHLVADVDMVGPEKTVHLLVSAIRDYYSYYEDRRVTVKDDPRTAAGIAVTHDPLCPVYGDCFCDPEGLTVPDCPDEEVSAVRTHLQGCTCQDPENCGQDGEQECPWYNDCECRCGLIVLADAASQLKQDADDAYARGYAAALDDARDAAQQAMASHVLSPYEETTVGLLRRIYAALDALRGKA